MSGARTGLRAAVSAALLFFGAVVPAGAQEATSASGTLPSGVTYAIRPDPGQSGAAVALWYRAPSGGFEATSLPGLSRLAAATVAASAPITGTPLGRLIDRFGGRISVAAYPDSIAITALVPPDRVAQVVRAMTADYFAPVVTPQGLAIAQRDVAEDALYRSYEPTDAIEDAHGAALFADGPLHDGTIGTADTFKKITVDKVRTFAERAFRPANAILVLTGNVDPAAVQNVASRDGAQATAEPAAPQSARPASSPLRREANVAGTGLGWTGPAITDEGSATALDFVADALFGPKTGIVTKALASRKASVTGKFVTYRNPGVFLVTISGDDAEAVRPIVERAIADAAKPMDPATFASARAAFVYRLLSDMETPAELADTYGWYTVEGAPAYAPAEGGRSGRYFTTAASLTPAAVARTVARYLSHAPAIVTLVQTKPTATGKRT